MDTFRFGLTGLRRVLVLRLGLDLRVVLCVGLDFRVVFGADADAGVEPGAALAGGASGGCVKSKQSTMPFVVAARAVSGSIPNVSSTNLSRLTCE